MTLYQWLVVGGILGGPAAVFMAWLDDGFNRLNFMDLFYRE